MDPELRRISPRTRTDYRELISAVSEVVWPELMLHDLVADAHWDGLFEDFGDYQFAFLTKDAEQVVGIANSVPLAWDGAVEDLPEEGWDWALIQSASDHAAGLAPRVLCAIQISIHPAFQGRGLSSRLLKEMLDLAREKGLKRLVAPVRPSLKNRYPLTPMANYVRWTDDRGLPFDPWLRVHVREGGTIVKVCPRAMQITGTIDEWQAWTELRFPESGAYVVPGALAPVQIDLESDTGTYVEPNVWMLHLPMGA